MKTQKIVLIILGIVLIAYLLYPKNVGGPMCGPVCPSVGLHTYSQSCLGIKLPGPRMTDSFSINCYGILVGEKKCYGVPYTDTTNFENREMDCNYPCNDNKVRSICELNETPKFQEVTLNCQSLKQRCKW